MMTTVFLGQMREKLLAEKIRLQTQLLANANAGHAGDSQPKWENYGDKEDENAAEVAAFSDAVGLGQALQSELAEVEAALQRIDEQTYGICKNCGQNIDEKRLRVRPMSLLCVACQEQTERR
ncbi:TraR/DksA family transcriptional regulator [Candidatus Uhrbacteria bacterium]|nr:TraR/DksA family transcriptional regulator [Candidatus Uhrbacteria bacterium]